MVLNARGGRKAGGVMGKGLIKYNFGSKNIWRCWAWNKIVNNLNKKPKDAVGLYLIGEDDDLSVAINKGFKKSNLIGIDLDQSRVNAHRAKGGIGICEDLSSVVVSWNGNPEIDFINADFCCGITKSMKIFLISCCGAECIKKGTPIIINALRGRDKDRIVLDLDENLSNLFKSIGKNKTIGDIKKHRGPMILHTLFLCCLSRKFGSEHFDKVLTDQTLLFTEEKDFWKNLSKIDFYSYKSVKNGAVQIMDSVFFKWPSDNLNYFSPLTSVQHKISAAKALRTMRRAA
jgi:hypothetical protein